MAGLFIDRAALDKIYPSHSLKKSHQYCAKQLISKPSVDGSNPSGGVIIGIHLAKNLTLMDQAVLNGEGSMKGDS